MIIIYLCIADALFFSRPWSSPKTGWSRDHASLPEIRSAESKERNPFVTLFRQVIASGIPKKLLFHKVRYRKVMGNQKLFSKSQFCIFRFFRCQIRFCGGNWAGRKSWTTGMHWSYAIPVGKPSRNGPTLYEKRSGCPTDSLFLQNAISSRLDFVELLHKIGELKMTLRINKTNDFSSATVFLSEVQHDSEPLWKSYCRISSEHKMACVWVAKVILSILWRRASTKP